MQIMTIEDLDFPDLLLAWRDGKDVGNCLKNGKIQMVKATAQFVLISTSGSPTKIAIRPARSLSEAENLAKQYLEREKARGSQVAFSEPDKEG